MPHINLKLWPGKSEEIKKELANRLTDVLVDTINVNKESVSVSIEEVGISDWTEMVYEEEILTKQNKLYKKPGYEPCKEKEEDNHFLEKVTAFILRNEKEILLIRHPLIGIKIPSGAVERGEAHHKAIFREANRETGLYDLCFKKYIGFEENILHLNLRRILYNAKVYARPDLSSLSSATLQRGLMVDVKQEKENFIQISYNEYEKGTNNVISYNVTGWVQKNKTTRYEKRHFYQLEYYGDNKERWEINRDHQVFECFWAPINHLPSIVYPQNLWVRKLLS